MESQKKYPKAFSFEFFPPRTEAGRGKLRAASRELTRVDPRYFSVTFGAGGSTRTRTVETVAELMNDTGVRAVPHLSCIGATEDNVRQLLHHYRKMGVRQIVALRGDIPSGMVSLGEFHHANELVEFIRRETGDHFEIEVAAYPEYHPQAPTPEEDLDNFVRKVRAGASSAITQYFFNPDAYFHFVDEVERRGLDVAIVPGVMPIINYRQLARFSDACGAEIPRWIRRRLESFGDDQESLLAFGHDVVRDLCQRLLDAGAPGLHFYTLNRAEPSLAVWRDLDLPANAA
ncbi:MAG TPA: methylenetetrahydrofolate reductase [NAD(P)H] [Gammaproteobacteria bacterium]|nr:methylenetetrahydrofolate reductase [NAD(P)H] [Gammaproteobacteria bacterium]